MEKPEELDPGGNPELVATKDLHQYLLDGYEERKKSSKAMREEQKNRIERLKR